VGYWWATGAISVTVRFRDKFYHFYQFELVLVLLVGTAEVTPIETPTLAMPTATDNKVYIKKQLLYLL